MIITIDGPVASGKSTIARLLAKKLHYYYLYSGLLYRAVAYCLIRNHGYSEVSIASPDMHLVHEIIACIDYTDKNDVLSILFHGSDITNLLKDAGIDQASSIMSGNPAVRNAVNQLQRTLAKKHDIVADGRDCGSVVFPHAEHKFFLTAPLEVRAQRWCVQQQQRGHSYTIEQAQQMIATRDDRDSKRAVAPLIVPQNALVIDTATMSIEKIVDHMLATLEILFAQLVNKSNSFQSNNHTV